MHVSIKKHAITITSGKLAGRTRLFQNIRKMLVLPLRVVSVLSLFVFLTSCSNGPSLPPELLPLSDTASERLQKQGMMLNAPIFIRIFKEESEFEVWKKGADGFFHHFKTYPICNWSGKLGPKQKQGDRQAPEGFYTVWAGSMNPKSKFHLSFNLGYPNRLDRAYGRTGQHLMVHGDCTSSGCYAMTNALVEEIYGLAREAIKGGQKGFRVQAFPFRMTKANLARHKKNKWYRFWLNLKQGYDAFERTRIPPRIDVCSKRYMINKVFTTKLEKNPATACPPYRHMKLADYTGPGYNADNPFSLIPAGSLQNNNNPALSPLPNALGTR